MPLQNRVNPFGEITAQPWRGRLMGNRGCLHDATDDGTVFFVVKSRGFAGGAHCDNAVGSRVHMKLHEAFQAGLVHDAISQHRRH